MRAPLKRLQRFACAVLVAASFQGIQTAHADWANFGTVSMTDAAHPKLINGYGCYTDGRDIVCDSAGGAVSFGTGGLITYGGMTVAGGISASAVSSTYVSATVLQINPSSMPCSTGLGGTIRYSSTSNTLEVCTGTTWSTLSSNTTPGNLSGSGSATAIAYWNGANSLTYENSATSGLYWDHANGRIGIGTNNPVTTLTISGTSGLAFDSAAAKSISWYTGGGYSVQIRGDASNVNLAFLLSGHEAARFNTAGNLGLGTQSPTATLQVSGTFTVSNSAQGETSPSLYVNSSGNVGLGTKSPNALLDVNGSIRIGQGTTSSSAYFVQANGGSNTLVLSADANNYANAAISLRGRGFTNWNPAGMEFYTGGAERMRIVSNGSIGVGTGAPGSSLTVYAGEIQPSSSGAACVSSANGGAIRYSAGALYYCNGSNTWSAISGGGAGFTGGGSATAIAFWNGPSSLTYESATTSGLYWDHTNSHLGVGTNAPSRTVYISDSTDPILEIAPAKGDTGFADILLSSGGISDSTWQLSRRAANQGNSFWIANYPSGSFMPRVVVSTGGNVGINGIITPTANLQVSGTFLVSQTGQNSLTSASFAVDNRGVSVSSIVHINGSAFSPIGAGGNAILSGTTSVSTSSAGSITFYAGGIQSMGIDGSGKVGIGTSTPDYSLTVSSTKGFAVTNGFKGMRLEFGGSNDFRSINADLYINNAASNPSNTYINPNGGYVGVGATSWNKQDGVLRVKGIQGSVAGALFDVNSTSNHVQIYFSNPNGPVGNISSNGTATAYNTTSDRRVKEDITDTREGLQKLMLLPVRDFVFKADPSHTIVTGFIAQELNKVFPEAVTTNGDNGETKLKSGTAPWSVDYGRVTPLIVKSVQDLKHLVDSDHEELAKLKAANDNLRIQVDTQQKQIDALTAANDNIEALQKAVRDLQARDEPLRSVR